MRRDLRRAGARRHSVGHSSQLSSGQRAL